MSQPPIPLSERISSPTTQPVPLDARMTSPSSPTASHSTFGGATTTGVVSPDLVVHPADDPNFNAPSPVSEPIMADLPGGVHMLGYERYNPYNPNHVKYCVHIPFPDGTMKKPHYIAFRVNTFTHRHTVAGRRDGTNEPYGDFGEDLVAAPCGDPMPDTVDDTQLTLLATTHPDAQAVDIAAGMMGNPGIIADIDWYRVLWEEKEELQRRECDLTEAWDRWCNVNSDVESQLTRAKGSPSLTYSTTVSAPPLMLFLNHASTTKKTVQSRGGFNLYKTDTTPTLTLIHRDQPLPVVSPALNVNFPTSTIGLINAPCGTPVTIAAPQDTSPSVVPIPTRCATDTRGVTYPPPTNTLARKAAHGTRPTGNNRCSHRRWSKREDASTKRRGHVMIP
ncbi:hypothetical protein H4582DRAFT_2059002 [Lactarius indigo]|nr:hypothetical protein H4582DRAFT_2059002 [Lactarius indigo]